jgi:hypothetical protein
MLQNWLIFKKVLSMLRAVFSISLEEYPITAQKYSLSVHFGAGLQRWGVRVVSRVFCCLGLYGIVVMRIVRVN